jgi:hypothetical protein
MTQQTLNPLFNAIDKQHQQMEELFLLHQEALLLTKLPLARTLFSAWKNLQIAHLNFENDYLLTELETLEETRWPHTLYLHEHKKVINLLNKAEHSLKELALEELSLDDGKGNTNKTHVSGKLFRRRLIELLEQHKSLKNVLEHHEQREQQGMLIELENHLSQEQASMLSNKLLEETEHALAAIYDNSQAWLEALESD